jgi:hypothetical protein
LIRASVFATCWAAAKFGLSASSRPAAVTPPTANRAAPSRKPRRSIAPCTYLSNSLIDLGMEVGGGEARSLAVGHRGAPGTRRKPVF